MANTVASRKQKGRRGQQKVVELILSHFPDLTVNDVSSTSMGCPGIDIKLSEAARKVFPYSCEVKNVERLNVWEALEQASNKNRDLTPLLIFMRNSSEIYCCLKLEDFLKLVSK